jgi:hypothetical protein
MALEIRRADYFHVSVKDRPGEAFRLLSQLSAGGVNLLAFGAMPTGPDRAQLTLFPDEAEALARFAEKAGLVLDGPHPALVVQGDDRLGALAQIHERLYEAKVNVFASNGVTDGRGGFGYVIYVQPGDIEAALSALGA